jgi:hypothetical protein
MGWREAVLVAARVIVAGTEGAVLIYNGTPAKGSLIGVIAGAAGSDQFGNSWPVGETFGVWSAVTGNVVQHFGLDAFGNVSLVNTSGNKTVFMDPSKDLIAIYTTAGVGLGNLSSTLASRNSTDDSGNAYLVGTTNYFTANGVFYAVSLQGNAVQYFTASAAGGPYTLAWLGTRDATDTTFSTNANQAASTDITKAWTIPAFDANVGTHYVIEVPYDGTLQNQALTLSTDLDAAGATGPPQGAQVSAGFLVAGTAFNGTVRVHLQVVSAGAGGNATLWTEGSFGASAALTAANSTILNGRRITVAFNTTVAHTLAVASLWGGLAAGQTITGYGSTFTRKGL